VLAGSGSESVSATRLKESLSHLRQQAGAPSATTPADVFANLPLEEQWRLAVAVLADAEMVTWSLQAGTAFATLIHLCRQPKDLLARLCAADAGEATRRMSAAAVLQLEPTATDTELTEMLMLVEPAVDRELAIIWLTTGSSRWFRALKQLGAERLLSLVPSSIRELGLANLEGRLPNPELLVRRD
jgi:hypothetical protein